MPGEVEKAREILMTKRKLNLILESNSTLVPPVNIGDLVQVFIKTHHEKGGKWTNA